MTKKEVATLSFKVLCLYTFVTAIDRLADVIYYIISVDQTVGKENILNLLMILVPLILLFTTGILLWYAAPFLASSIFKSKGHDNNNNASHIDIQEIAFSVVGLFVLAKALPEFVKSIIIFYTIATHYVEGGSPLASTIIMLLLQVLFGLWLLLGSKGIVKYICKRNNQGQSTKRKST